MENHCEEAVIVNNVRQDMESFCEEFEEHFFQKAFLNVFPNELSYLILFGLLDNPKRID